MVRKSFNVKDRLAKHSTMDNLLNTQAMGTLLVSIWAENPFILETDLLNTHAMDNLLITKAMDTLLFSVLSEIT